MKRTAIALTLVALSTFACDFSRTTLPTEPEPPPPPPAPPVTIALSAQCLSDVPGRISCEDTSASIPAGQIALIEWSGKSPAGVTEITGNGQAGVELSWAGLAPGDWVLSQSATATDGGKFGPKTFTVTVLGAP